MNELMEKLGTIKEPRKKDRFDYKLIEIIVMTILGIMAGMIDFPGIVYFCKMRENELKEHLELPYGIPSEQTFRRMYNILDPQEMQRALEEWAILRAGAAEEQHWAIDGKTSKGSRSARKGQNALHTVSVWCDRCKISFGEIHTTSKGLEIPSIKDLLSKLEIKGAIITADAIACQTEIAELIIEKEADYVLAVKDNQSNANEEIAEYMEFADQTKFLDIDHEQKNTLGKEHGVVEKRAYTCIYDLDGLSRINEFTGVQSIGRAIRFWTNEQGEEKSETRYFISSLGKGRMDEFIECVRGHWSIENNCHRTLDVLFKEDDCCVHNEDAVKNLSLIRKLALHFLANGQKGKKKIPMSHLSRMVLLDPSALWDLVFAPFKV